MIVQGKVWGETIPIFNRNNVEVHFIRVKKGGYCSKHYHKSKFNQFTVMYGKLKITIWKDYGDEILEDVTIVKSGQSCIVSPGEYHRFEALEEDTQALETYWVTLQENDIVREDQGGIQNETQADLSNEYSAGGTDSEDDEQEFGSEHSGDSKIHCRECETFNVYAAPKSYRI